MRRGVLILTLVALTLSAAGLLYAARPTDGKTLKVTVAYFPNVTHAQALLGHADGDFERELGPSVEIDWKVFNAGPAAVEAIFAGKLDIAYIGPSPAVNGYIRSQGEALRVVAGAASGGAALVVRSDAGITSAADFEGRKVASPQLGNTQDVALRAWLDANGLGLKEKGGKVQVIPMSNADQYTLMQKREIDAAWTVEPWVSMLVASAGARVYLDEASLWPDGRYATTLLVVRKKFLDEHPDVVRSFAAVHERLTERIHADPDTARVRIGEELQKITHKPIPDAILKSALARIVFTTDPMEASVRSQAEAAHRAGFLKQKPDVSGLYQAVGTGGNEADRPGDAVEGTVQK